MRRLRLFVSNSVQGTHERGPYMLDRLQTYTRIMPLAQIYNSIYLIYNVHIHHIVQMAIAPLG